MPLQAFKREGGRAAESAAQRRNAAAAIMRPLKCEPPATAENALPSSNRRLNTSANLGGSQHPSIADEESNDFDINVLQITKAQQEHLNDDAEEIEKDGGV